MSEDGTPRLALPMLASGQAQKEMTHNEALTRIDLGLHATAATPIGREVPPEDPQPGQCWIVGAAPQGPWEGQAQALAGWTTGGWRFVAPCEGMRVWLGETDGNALYRDGNWHVGEAFGRLFIEGKQVVGPRLSGIAEPEGGSVVDAEARAAIVSVLEALRQHGLVQPTL